MQENLKVDKEKEIKEEVNETPTEEASTAATAATDMAGAGEETPAVSGAEDGDTLTPNATEENPVEENEAAPAEDATVEEESTPPQEEPQEKLLTQSQVNELVGRARQEGRESALKELLERYGVNDDNELNEVFGKGQNYDILTQEYDTQGTAYRSAMSENALLKTHVEQDRWDDVKAILGAKGLDVTPENIESLIPSHPEWLGSTAQSGVGTEGEGKLFSPEMGEALANQAAANQQSPQQPPATLRKLGNEPSPVVEEESEKEKANKLFGLS